MFSEMKPPKSKKRIMLEEQSFKFWGNLFDMNRFIVLKWYIYCSALLIETYLINIILLGSLYSIMFTKLYFLRLFYL